MDVILLHVDDVKHANLIIAAKTLPGDHAGQYLARGRTGKDGARIASPYTHLNKIYIDPAIKGGRPKRIVGHEIGHWLGVGHQARNDSIMSYGYRAPSSFGAIDIERLTRAY